MGIGLYKTGDGNLGREKLVIAIRDLRRAIFSYKKKSKILEAKVSGDLACKNDRNAKPRR
jgi:hypothetical protein